MRKKVDAHEFYEWQLLQHVESTPLLTHRKAAMILGVSVKLAHDVVSKMIGKGYFHVVKHHARRWDYFLTPQGLAEKARLTVDFLEFSMQFYREARKLSAQLCRDLAESDRRTIAFLGAGDLAEITYLGVREWGLRLSAVYDDSGKTSFLSVPILPIARLEQDASDAIVVCVYDPKQPLQDGYLPEHVRPLPTMHWIFNAANRRD